MALTFVYTVGDSIYINLTNRCPNDCVFCERNTQSGVGDAESLWLDHEPSAREVLNALAAYDLRKYPEIVFCGYGEPLCRIDEVLAVCRALKKMDIPPIRVNTNGLSDLINGRPTAADFAGLVDIMSLSLNAPTAGEYDAICRSEYGPSAFDALLTFARECLEAGIHVVFSVVDVIGAEKLEQCRELAAGIGAEFRVRQCH